MTNENKALLYVRVSSKEQESGYSLDAQEKLGLDYAKRNGLDVIKTWRGSESAWKTDRKHFYLMIEYAKKNGIKNIIFDITDRMTRNSSDMVKIADLVKEFDVTIHFSRMNKIYNRNSKPDEIFMLDIEVAVAKKLSNDISLKTGMGLQEKIEQGGYGGSAPLGYINNYVKKTIEPDPETAHFIKRAYELVCSGNYSLSMLSDQLYSEGMRSKRKKTKLAESKMYDLLRNPIYYGYVKWKDKLYKGNHEPIISKELFDRAQSVFKKKPRVDSRQNHFFNSMVQCEICGCKLTPGLYKKRKYLYYHCTFSKGKHDKAPYLTEEQLLGMFEKTVKNASLTDTQFEILKKALKEESGDTTERLENTLASLLNEKKTLRDRLSRLYDDKLDNKVTETFWKEKKIEYEKTLFELETRIDALSVKNAYHYKEALVTLELAKELTDKYKTEDLAEKVDLLKTVALNHTFNGETLNVLYKKPFDTIAKINEFNLWGE